MGLKFFDSMSVSTSEIARLGTSYSALLSNFGLQATLPFSIHFNCRRGLIPMAQWSGTSDRKYLAENVAAKTSSRDLNGTNVIGTHLNGAAFNLYFRNIRTLDAGEFSLIQMGCQITHLPLHLFCVSLFRIGRRWERREFGLSCP